MTFVLFGAVLLGPALGDLTGVVALRRAQPHRRSAWSRSRSRCSGPAASGRPSPSSAGSGRAAWPPSCSRVLVLDEEQPPTRDRLLHTSFVTVALSVLAARLTAAPLTARYADWHDARVAETPVESGAEEQELPWRLQDG